MKDSSIKLNDLSLTQKVAQMLIINGNKFNPAFSQLGIGGIFLSNGKSKEEYKRKIREYSSRSKIKLFVSCDLEGYVSARFSFSPFNYLFQNKNFGDVKDEKEAYGLGVSHGSMMKEMGFNINFSPVVETDNKVWPGRSFRGSRKEIKNKIQGYIKGLRSRDILATAKHYPGGNLSQDPHKWFVRYNLKKEDIELFDSAIKNKVDAIMIGHTIVNGAINSKGRQSTVSLEVISHLRRRFNGLIITDDIDMFGLKFSYLFKRNKLYVDLVKAGNDIILTTHPPVLSSPFVNYSKQVERGINAIVNAVKRGEIPEYRINESCKRILKAKGYKVID